MGFFDLNIPYETTQSTKTTRMRLVIKAMELGYTGIAYNRTIKGVMSDHDRCSIPLFSLSSLLNLALSVSSSVNLHRDLLNIPRASPFRQYTRLTVCVENPAQGHVINRGNPVLKSYDLVAVRPLNQTAFDYACEKSEADIIAIDFSEKLPFRLKQAMVKAGMERGVYFEITYSDLIVDVQVRRQMLSNAKLLVDWTRGKNLIVSSAASSVNEFRGPCDVVNLTSLLGLSMERAKAAVSKNCRNLIANALRRKHFYKETIRVEPISSDEKSDSKDLLSLDWLKWDPISSEGDLQLDDMAKSFSATARVSKTVKAIDFALIIESMPSCGENFFAAIKATEAPIATIGVLKEPGGLDLIHKTDHTSLYNTPIKNQTSVYESSQLVHSPRDAVEASNKYKEIGTLSNISEEEPKNPNGSDVLFPSIETQMVDLQSQSQIPTCELDVVLPNANVISHTSAMETELNAACVTDPKIDILSDNINFLAPQIEMPVILQGSDVVLSSQNVALDEDKMEMDKKHQEDASVAENVSGGEQLTESRDDTMPPVDYVPFPIMSGERKVKYVSSVANRAIPEEVVVEGQEHGAAKKFLPLDDDLKVTDKFSVANCVSSEEMMMEVQTQEQAGTEITHPTVVPSLTGKFRAKQRTPNRTLVFPLKRLLHPMPFKKKAKKNLNLG